ncbi:vacuolar triacylglycerol lipase [Xylariaceae sp. FL0255]|nr:vacuolar triacylglycerol lipase [Xylariaceae sp. FL0255]
MLTRLTFRHLAAALCSFVGIVEAISATVDTTCNSYAGVAGTNNITSWLGIRFAEAPTGNLRFEPPQTATCSGSTFPADTHGPWCLATGASPTDTSTSEDCLFMDIYAPSDATSDSKLPVFLFIQGGGFNADSNPNLNGEGLIIASNYSMVFVTFNYRVGPYGFITDGDKITANNGLRDQRLAMEWVQKYISHFGGDPSHVVLGGDSAGAGSIAIQLAAFGGRNDNLFVAAAAESVTFGPVLTVAQSQYQYNNFTAKAGCDVADSLACLRNKTAEELQEINQNVPYPGGVDAPLYEFNPAIDGDFIQTLTEVAFDRGNFVKIPMIVGDDTNEGTIFTPQNTSTIAESELFIKSQFPNLTEAQLNHITELYPNPDEADCPNSGCYWRQVSNAYGDMRYLCTGLFVSSAVANAGISDIYTYHYNVEDPTQVAEGYGVPHTVELNAIIGPAYAASPPASYLEGGINAPVSPVIQAYWVSFIKTFNPNTHKATGAATWHAWNPFIKNRLLFETGGSTKMEYVNAIQREQCNYFYSIGIDAEQ